MHNRKSTRVATIIILGATLFAIACGKDTKPETAVTSEAKPTAAAPNVKLTGDTVVVEAYSDGVGNYFKPNRLEAHRGDVVRFVLKSGVHNVHFLPDSNPGRAYLPPASDMLQLPDQTYDVIVAFESGIYYFQCDPHALLGMIGHLKVEDDH